MVEVAKRRDIWNAVAVDRNGFRRGVKLFNRGDFFDAHEVLEGVWRAAPSDEKKFLQGLIQVAVGLHHYSTGNKVGARSLLARGDKNLSGYAEDMERVNVAGLRANVGEWIKALENGDAVPALPRIEFVGR